MEEIVILGGGITGLGLAWKLAERGMPVSLLEAKSAVGGLARTIRDGGYSLDVGTHSFYTDDPEILETVLAFFHPPLRPFPRRVKLRYRGALLDYPFRPGQLLRQVGPATAFRAGTSFLAARLRSPPVLPDGDTVESWAVRNFGRFIHETFFRPYTDHFWKRPSSELSADAIPERGDLNLCSLALGLLGWRPPAASFFERERLLAYYPPTGFGEIAEEIARRARDAGARISCRCRVTGLKRLPEGRLRVIYASPAGSEAVDCDRVISTIPVNQLVAGMTPPPPPEVTAAGKALEYLALAVVGVAARREGIMGCAYAYALDRPYNRLMDMNEHGPATSPPGEDILLAEIPCRQGDAVWNTPDNILAAEIVHSLENDGILARTEIGRTFVLREPEAYPIFRKGYRESLRRIAGYLEGVPGISLLGRTGEFRYLNGDACLKKAFAFASRLLREKSP